MSSVNTNEDEQLGCSDSKRKTIRDDFPAAAAYFENNWGLLLHDGQHTLIDGNVEELIGWAIHIDGSFAPKNAPSPPQNQTVAQLPAAGSEQTTREDEAEEKDNVSVSSLLSGSHENDQTVAVNGTAGGENGLSGNMKTQQGTKKRKRSGKAKASSGNISYQDFSSSLSPSNMLRSLPNIPIRPSVLHYLHDCFVETMEQENTSDKEEAKRVNSMCWESLDTSALVALGIIVEEMLTATLIPLAEMHVHRCRHIAEQEASSEAWTLPPTEAIMKLMTSRSPSYVNPLGSLPTVRMPSRISSEITDPNSSRQVIPAWINKHKTDLEQIHKLWHLYKHFLPSQLEPTIVVTSKPRKATDASKPKKRRKTSNSEDTAEDSRKVSQNEELLNQDPVVLSYADV